MKTSKRKTKKPAKETSSTDETPGEGHNSGTIGVSGKMLTSLIARVERLEEEKRECVVDIKELYSEAKAQGFDVKIMRKVVAIRKRDKADVVEEDALIDTYLHAIGYLSAE